MKKYKLLYIPLIILVLFIFGFIKYNSYQTQLHDINRKYVDDNGKGLIKGNENAGQKIYHMPNQSTYKSTQAEWVFDSEAEAQKYGFRRSGSPENKWYSKYISDGAILGLSLFLNVFFIIWIAFLNMFYFNKKYKLDKTE